MTVLAFDFSLWNTPPSNNMATAIYNEVTNVDIDIVLGPINTRPGLLDDYDFSQPFEYIGLFDAPECADPANVTATTSETTPTTDNDDAIIHFDVREAFDSCAMPLETFMAPPATWGATIETSTALSVLVLEFVNDFPIPINYLPVPTIAMPVIANLTNTDVLTVNLPAPMPVPMPPILPGARRLLFDSGAQVHAFPQPCLSTPDSHRRGDGMFGQPIALRDSGNAAHQTHGVFTYCGRLHPNDEAPIITILDCSIVPGFSCAVISAGVLWRTQRIATILNDRPHLCFRYGSTIEIQTANDCYFFDVYDVSLRGANNTGLSFRKYTYILHRATRLPISSLWQLRLLSTRHGAIRNAYRADYLSIKCTFTKFSVMPAQRFCHTL